MPQTFLCRRASARLCYHKYRVRTGLRRPLGRMGRVGGFSPSHIAVPVSGSFLGSFLGSCVIAGVPGRTSLLFSSRAGYWSQCNLLPSKFIRNQVASGPEIRGVLDSFLSPPPTGMSLCPCPVASQGCVACPVTDRVHVQCYLMSPAHLHHSPPRLLPQLLLT